MMVTRLSLLCVNLLTWMLWFELVYLLCNISINCKLKREKVHFSSPSFSFLLLAMWRWCGSSCSKLAALRGRSKEGREGVKEEPGSQVTWDCYTSPKLKTTGPLLTEQCLLPSCQVRNGYFLSPEQYDEITVHPAREFRLDTSISWQKQITGI